MELKWWISIYCNDTIISVQFQWLELIMELSGIDIHDHYPITMMIIMDFHEINMMNFQL